MRAAASSMASGTPSRRRQISSTSSRLADGSNVREAADRPLVEQLDARPRRFEGRDDDELLVAEAEALSRRGEDPHVRAALGDGVGQVGRTVDDVFAVVQDEQCPARLQRRHDRFGQRPPQALLHVQDAGNRPRHLARRAVAGELDEPAHLPPPPPALTSTSARSAAARASRVLPIPPGPTSVTIGELASASRMISRSVVAADQSTQATREIPAAAVVGPQRRMFAVAELEDALLGDDTLETERPEITQVAPVEQCRRHPGHQRLAAVTGGGEPGGDDQGRTEIALPPLLGLTGVQADPNPDRRSSAGHRSLPIAACSSVAQATASLARWKATPNESPPVAKT